MFYLLKGDYKPRQFSLCNPVELWPELLTRGSAPLSNLRLKFGGFVEGVGTQKRDHDVDEILAL